MAVGFLDACAFRAVSAGTGDFVVSAALTGWQTPAGASAVNGTTYRYRAYSNDGTEWEVGYGVYTTSTVTLARTTIVASTNGGSKVDFTAAPAVALTVHAGDVLTAAERTKLAAIEALADVTDAGNVAAAGAIMDGDSEVTEQADAVWEAGVGTDPSIVAPDAIAAAIAALSNKVETGSYTGDGATSQVISLADSSITPKYVKIWQRETSADTSIDVWETTAEILDDNASGGSIEWGVTLIDFETNRIIAVGAGSFTVDDNSSDVHPNKSGQAYNYMVIG